MFLTKSRQDFSGDKGTTDLKCIRKDRGARKAATILKRKNKMEGIARPSSEADIIQLTSSRPRGIGEMEVHGWIG